MLLGGNRGTTKPAVTCLVPRQVLLEAQRMKKDSSETLENGASNKILDSEKKRKKKQKNKGFPQKSMLLQTIAAYLNTNGFSKTLTALQSESLIEIDDWKANSLDLEDMCRKYLGSSECPTGAELKGSKEQEIADSQKDGTIKKDDGEAACDGAVEALLKKKRKKTGAGDADVATESNRRELDNDTAECPRKSSEKLENNGVDELHVKSRDKKKKKSKLGSDSLGVETKVNSQLPKSVTESIPEEFPSDTTNVKPKDKKKKKRKSISEEAELTGGFIQAVSKKDDVVTPEEDVIAVVKKDSKKRKRLASEDKDFQADDELNNKDMKHSKEEGLEGTKEPVQRESISAVSEYLNPKCSKKREVKDQVHQMSSDKLLEDLTEFKVSTGFNGLEKIVEGANGNLEKNGKGGPTPKSKEHNGSAEPKTVKAFQRVKVDEVKFVDERLQDNSYWAKSGADTGYGAKAEEVLGKVRGRDFRHEKTKKKRGSYRGGQIDLQSHSIKFNYSDEDE